MEMCSKVHGVQDSVLQHDPSARPSRLSSLLLVAVLQMYFGVVDVIATIPYSLISLNTAGGQPGANPHFCSRTHSSQTNHRLWGEILQKFPRGNVGIYSFSR